MCRFASRAALLAFERSQQSLFLPPWQKLGAQAGISYAQAGSNTQAGIRRAS